MMEEGTEAVSYGGQFNTEKIGGLYSIFDTGASDIFMSILWYESFVEQFYAAAGIEYEINEGSASATCEADYPDLYFLLRGVYLT